MASSPEQGLLPNEQLQPSAPPLTPAPENAGNLSILFLKLHLDFF